MEAVVVEEVEEDGVVEEDGAVDKEVVEEQEDVEEEDKTRVASDHAVPF